MQWFKILLWECIGQRCLKTTNLKTDLCLSSPAVQVRRDKRQKTNSCQHPKWLRPLETDTKNEKADDIEIDTRIAIY